MSSSIALVKCKLMKHIILSSVIMNFRLITYILFPLGMLFILISLWNIAITECVPIKNQSTMLIMMVVWDILAGKFTFLYEE